MRRSSAVLITAAAALLSACGGGREDSLPTGPLRIAVLPDQSPDAVRARYEPLIDHISARIGRECDLIVPADYEELLVLAGAGAIDVGWFGGLTFARAEAAHGFEPLAMRDIDLEFSSVVVVRSDSEAQSIDDLAGTEFTFGPRLSTSGNLMPRYFMRDLGIDSEADFGRVAYSGAHDRTALDVASGAADAGAMNALIYDAMVADGRLAEGALRILWRTPTYRDNVWAVAPSIGDGERDVILDALLSLDATDPEQASILAATGAGYYLSASSTDYDEIRAAAISFELLDTDG